MKRILFLFLCSLLALGAGAKGKDGYQIRVRFTERVRPDLKNRQDSLVFLAHYFGKSLPTIYKTDSAYLNKQGQVVFNSKDSILGGIYIIMMGDKSTFFEFLLDNGDNMSIVASRQVDTGRGPIDSLVFTNSPENVRFQQYSSFLRGFGQNQEKLLARLKTARTSADSEAVRKQITEAYKGLTAYRRSIAAANPRSLLGHIFNALEVPDVPEGTHYLPSGKVDSNWAYHFYKGHYWDKFDFSDGRLIHTPILDAKLDEYMNRLVIPIVDSVEKESDYLLAKARANKELFRYSLWYLTKFAEDSKIMGMDEVFVYLVEHYFMKGDAWWLTPEQLAKYKDRAVKIKPNIMYAMSKEMRMKDVNGQWQSMHATKAPYTLLVFFSPDCGHCIQEMPKLDSVYEAVLRKKGVKVYTIATEDQAKWQEFITKNHIEDWTNVADWEHQSDYKMYYDIYGTPVLYLLDEDKRIIGKRFDHTNILEVIENEERKRADARKQAATPQPGVSSDPGMH